MTNHNSPYFNRDMQDCADIIKEKNPKLSSYESIMIAVQLQRNKMIERAFVLTPDDAYPTALEKIVHTIKDCNSSINCSLDELHQTLMLMLKELKEDGKVTLDDVLSRKVNLTDEQWGKLEDLMNEIFFGVK